MAIDIKSPINIETEPKSNTEAARLGDISWGKLKDKPRLDFLPTAGGIMTGTIESQKDVAIKQTGNDGSYSTINFSGLSASHVIRNPDGHLREIKVYKKSNESNEDAVRFAEKDASGVAKEYKIWGQHNMPAETGTWSPAIAGDMTAGSHTYSLRNGWYSRVGNIVFIGMRIQLLALDTSMTGRVMITGLPFVTNTRTSYATIPIMAWSGITFPNNYTFLTLGCGNNVDHLTLYINGSGIGWGNLFGTSNLSDTMDIYASGVYSC